jgi:hypothetical protein
MFAGILTAALGTYLALTSRENKAVMRSLCWNSALPLAEAGIEEALSHLSKNYWNYAADGWTPTGGSNYFKQRVLGDSYVDVTLSGTPGSLVTIRATGYAHWMDTNYISRDLVVTAQTISSMTYPGAVATNISIGGNFTADSYDSADPLHSNNGAYDPAKRTALAFIATPSVGFTVSGSSHIYGYVASGPGGSVSAKGAAIVGDENYYTKGSIQSGHVTNNFVTAIPDVQVPFTSANAPTKGDVDGTTYDYVLDGGKFMASQLSAGKSSAKMVVTSDSILYVTGAIDLSKIVFQNGAKLDLYLGGSDITFAPVLEGPASTQFRVLGLPTCTDMSITAGTAFVGIIYAPECDVKAAGHASISGAITSRGLKCTGSFDFHYDVAAGKSVILTPVKIISWAESY